MDWDDSNEPSIFFSQLRKLFINLFFLVHRPLWKRLGHEPFGILLTLGLTLSIGYLVYKKLK